MIKLTGPEFLHSPFENSKPEETLQAQEIIDLVINKSTVLGLLLKLAEPRPTGTLNHTGLPIVESLLELGVPEAQIQPRIFRTAELAVHIPHFHPLDYLAVAHADNLRYVPTHKTAGPSVELTPNCNHGVEVGHKHPAMVMRFNSKLEGYEVVSEGQLGTDGENLPYYTGLKPRGGFDFGDSVVFKNDPTFDTETNTYTGRADNDAGVVASIISLAAFSRILKKNRTLNWHDLNAGFLFPDGEEGHAGASASFSRGSRTVVHRYPNDLFPEYVVVVDGHDVDADQLTPHALFASVVSGGKGTVVKPDIYVRGREFMSSLSQAGVSVVPTESVPSAKTSRSDDVASMEKTMANVIMGWAGADHHYNKGVPTTNMDSIVNAAKALAWMNYQSAIETRNQHRR